MRTMEEIQKDYAAAATTLGDVEYRIAVMEEDSRKIRRKMRQLNIEAQGVKNAEENKKLEEAASEQKAGA